MITIESGRRRRSDGEQISFPTQQVNVIRALENLVMYEFGCGGQVTDISETRLSVSTRIMAYDDHVIFTGTAEEMRPLVEIAAGYLLACADDRTQESVIDYLCNRAPERIRGQALFITRYGAAILGSTRAHVALIAFSQVTDETQIAAALRLTLRELFTITEFVIAGDCTFAEALEMAETENTTVAV